MGRFAQSGLRFTVQKRKSTLDHIGRAVLRLTSPELEKCDAGKSSLARSGTASDWTAALHDVISGFQTISYSVLVHGAVYPG